MAKSHTIIGAITEELGELGKKVVTEAVKAPVDIATGVFEKKQRPVAEKTPFDMLDKAKTQTERKLVARDVLQELRQFKKLKEPSMYEKKMREEGEKKEKSQQQARVAAWQQLPKTGAHARRGDLRNITKKQTNPEIGKNMQQG